MEVVELLLAKQDGENATSIRPATRFPWPVQEYVDVATPAGFRDSHN